MKLSLLIVLLLFSVTLSAQNRSPYIYKVYDYCPAPGQFINETPFYEEGFTREDMAREAETFIANDERSLVSLGGWGGYIVFGFDHPVVNVKGMNDFRIQGNAFLPSETGFEGGLKGGSSEPGIVLVAYDTNGNGLPDDTWYELAGSEYSNSQTIRNYEITYYKPANKMDDIAWSDNRSNTGYIYRNTFHTLYSYWPEWIADETLTFTGIRLADNYSIVESGNNKYYIQEPYDWGYADNMPNDHEGSEFNIEWAVDKDGNAVYLSAIHFIKIYTAVNQYCGALGESSTDIIGAVDLHPEAESLSIPGASHISIRLLTNPVKETLVITSSEQTTLNVFDLHGRLAMATTITSGNNRIDCSGLPKGIYILSAEAYKAKFVKR